MVVVCWLQKKMHCSHDGHPPSYDIDFNNQNELQYTALKTEISQNANFIHYLSIEGKMLIRWQLCRHWWYYRFS